MRRGLRAEMGQIHEIGFISASLCLIFSFYLFTSAINGHTHKLTEALPSPTVLTTTSLPAGPAALCLPIDQQQQPSSCSTEALPSPCALPCNRGERFAAHKASSWIRCRGRVLLLHNGGDQGTSSSFPPAAATSEGRRGW